MPKPRPKPTGPRGKNALQDQFNAHVAGFAEFQAEHLVSKHAHGPATETNLKPPKKKQKRQHFETYLRPDGMPVQLTKGAFVCALIYDYPNLTDEQIARLAGVNKRTLYKFPFFVQARRAQSDTRVKPVARTRMMRKFGDHWEGERLIDE
jgi:hypothetical protein